MDRREAWNARYRVQQAQEAAESSFARSVTPYLPASGRALDVAGGAGRHAVWLARQGLDVTIADFASAGLDRAMHRALREGVRIRPAEVDLESEGLPEGSWDVIFVHYFLHRPLCQALADALNPGGVLLYCQPTVTNQERHEKPSRRFLLAPLELPGLFPSLEVVSYEEGWTDEGYHEAQLVARAPK